MKGKNEKQQKVLSFLLAFTMVLSIFAPSIDVLAQELENNNVVEENLLEDVTENNETEESVPSEDVKPEEESQKEEVETEEKVEEEKENNETLDKEAVEEEEVNSENEADANKEEEKAGEQKKVTILGTTDLHGRFVSYDYAANSDVDGGLDQIATIVKNEKKTDPNLLIVDNGDTVQGNYNHLFKGKTNPMIKAMNVIGYDAFALGNHEFNQGLEELENFKSQANENLKILCANLYKDGKRVYEPYVIKKVNGLDVAIIGVVSPNIVNWDAVHLAGHTTTAPDAEVDKVIDEIEAKGGADLYFVSSHVGVNNEYGNGDSATDIANKNPEVSGVLAGHSHATVESTAVNNAVISQPRNNGGSVSKFEFTLEEKDGEFKVVEKKSSLINTKGVAEDPELKAALDPEHKVALEDANGVIGTLDKDLAEPNEIKDIPESAISDQGITDLINKVQYHYSTPVVSKFADYDKSYHVSGAALLDAKSNLKAGNITKASIARIYKYDNKLYTIKTNGKQLKKYAEWTASFFNTYKEGDLTISFNPEIRFYNYDMLDGVKYDINVSKEPGKRIENFVYEKDGKAVEDSDIVYLTVNDYRYNTVLNPKVFDAGEHEKIQDTGADSVSDVRDMIAVYIEEVAKGQLKREVDNNWKIVGNNWNKDQRAKAVEAINSGKVKIPTSEDGRTPNAKSVTWNDVRKALAETTINILSINDFHGSILESGKNIGAAKLAAEVKRIKSEIPNTVFVGAGDLYQGSAISNLLYGKPVVDVLKEMGMKYTALGNHEFDWGIDKIETWNKDIQFLASNVYDKTTGKPVEWAKPYAIEEFDGVKIGFLGLATPESAYKTKPENVATLEFKNPTEATDTWSKHLREVEKVDLVIVLSHLGAEQSEDGTIIGEAADLAKTAKDVDAIICGHSHEYIAGEVNGVPVVQADNKGRALGKLEIDKFADGKVTITPSYDKLYTRVSTLPEDSVTKTIVEKYEADLNPILNEVIATTDTDLVHDRKYNGVTKLGQLTTQYMAEIAGTQIALTNSGGIRTSIAKGNITVGNMWDVMPFDNTLVTMKLKGSDLKRVMEHGVMNTNVGWVQYHGLRVYYDSKKEAGNRISSMRLLDGTKIEMDKYYTVVTNDFMYSKGDNFDFTGAIEVKDTGVAIRDALIEKMKKVKEIKFVYDEKVAIDGQDPNSGNGESGSGGSGSGGSGSGGNGSGGSGSGGSGSGGSGSGGNGSGGSGSGGSGSGGSGSGGNGNTGLPETGDIGVLPYGMISVGVIATLIFINKKKKIG
ncbi:MAG: 5'-nucleotidase C-terminal domain-containing protein [Sarcina sp.]